MTSTRATNRPPAACKLYACIIRVDATGLGIGHIRTLNNNQELISARSQDRINTRSEVPFPAADTEPQIQVTSSQRTCAFKRSSRSKG